MGINNRIEVTDQNLTEPFTDRSTVETMSPVKSVTEAVHRDFEKVDKKTVNILGANILSCNVIDFCRNPLNNPEYYDPTRYNFVVDEDLVTKLRKLSFLLNLKGSIVISQDRILRYCDSKWTDDRDLPSLVPEEIKITPQYKVLSATYFTLPFYPKEQEITPQCEEERISGLNISISFHPHRSGWVDCSRLIEVDPTIKGRFRKAQFDHIPSFQPENCLGVNSWCVEYTNPNRRFGEIYFVDLKKQRALLSTLDAFCDLGWFYEEGNLKNSD